MQYQTSIEIDASAAEVWSVLTRADDYSEWEPNITKVEGTIGLGERTILDLSESFEQFAAALKERVEGH
jgi:hypothetical protein